MGFPSKTYLYGIRIKVSPIEISGVSVAEHNRFVKRCGPRSHAPDEEREGRQSTRFSEVWLKPDPALKGLRMQGGHLSFFWYGANKNTFIVDCGLAQNSTNLQAVGVTRGLSKTNKLDYGFRWLIVQNQDHEQRKTADVMLPSCRLHPFPQHLGRYGVVSAWWEKPKCKSPLLSFYGPELGQEIGVKVGRIRQGGTMLVSVLFDLLYKVVLHITDN